MAFKQQKDGNYLAQDLTCDEIREVLQGLHSDKVFTFPREVASKYLTDQNRMWKVMYDSAKTREKMLIDNAAPDADASKKKGRYAYEYKGEPIDLKERRLQLREREVIAKEKLYNLIVKKLDEITSLLTLIKDGLGSKQVKQTKTKEDL